MKNLYFILSALLLSQSFSVFSQQVQKTNALANQYKNISQEGIYVHYSSSVLFAGEYLFYKVFCINKNTKWLSGISEIAYVELIAENGEPVFKHKVELVAGEADSDFFIPTYVESGSYKLIAYTRWMKNVGLGSFFQADIGIINPYKQNQKAILAGSFEDTSVLDSKKKGLDASSDDTRGFALQLDKKTFGIREKVMLDFKNFKGGKGNGKYSLSVRKIDAVSQLLKHNNLNTNIELFNSTSNTKTARDKTFYLPEYSGTILRGRVIEKQTNLPAKQNVAISVSGNNFLFRAKSTNDKGEFVFFALDANYGNNDAVIQVLGDNKKDYKIVMEEDEAIDYTSLSFTPFQIDESVRNVITERSIYNQVENGYYSIKPDTIRPIKPNVPFTYYEDITTTNLDEFTRFSTMKEVFTELIKNAWTGTDTLGNHVVKVRQDDDDEETNFLPLLFIDGVFVQNHDRLLSYNALKVDKISVLRKYYIYGTTYYQGVILVETKLKDYQNQEFGDYLKSVELYQPQQNKSYFEQAYSRETFEKEARTPDYRTQLLWEPNIELSTAEMSFQFFTSDNLGKYEISVEGVTVEGKPVSLHQTFIVE
jgi:hypothetical protein